MPPSLKTNLPPRLDETRRRIGGYLARFGTVQLAQVSCDCHGLPTQFLSACPQQEIIALYHELMPTNPRALHLEQGTLGTVCTRWCEMATTRNDQLGEGDKTNKGWGDGRAFWDIVETLHSCQVGLRLEVTQRLSLQALNGFCGRKTSPRSPKATITVDFCFTREFCMLEIQAPHSAESKCAVLGSLLLTGGHCFDKVADLLADNDFYYRSHLSLYRIIGTLVLVHTEQPAGVVTVTARLDMLEVLQAGGRPGVP